MRILLYILIGCIFLYLLVCALSWKYQTSLLFHPQKTEKDETFSFSNPYEEVWLETSDNVRLHALLFKRSGSRGLIVYFHGNAGNLSSWGHVSEDFLSQGFDILLLDYRGYGKSEGEINSEKDLNYDADACMSYALRLRPEHEIHIFGRSIGTGPACYLAQKKEKGFLLLETPFTSMKDLGRHYFSFIPTSFLLRFSFPNEERLKSTPLACYIFHGTKDEIIPYEMGKTLSKYATSFCTVENGGHNNLSQFQIYRSCLKNALAQIP